MLRNERSSYRQLVDLEVVVDVRGIRLPINARIVDISVTGCRIRSWIALERNSNIAFDWPREGVKLRLAGTVAARRPSTEGETFEYGVTFTGLLPAESDVLAKEIIEAQRREAFNRAQRRRIAGQTLRRQPPQRVPRERRVSTRSDNRRSPRRTDQRHRLGY